MKLLFDQNLSRKLVSRLDDIFSNSSHVQFEGLEDKSDTEIWNFAKLNGFCIVTQDADFTERSRLYGSPPKVIWLRCGNAPTRTIEALIRAGQGAIEDLINSPTIDCLEIH